MHGRSARHSYPLGIAPFVGISLLTLVLILLIGTFGAWQYRDSLLTSRQTEREIAGLDYVAGSMRTLLDWGGASDARSPEAERRIAADLSDLRRRTAEQRAPAQVARDDAALSNTWTRATKTHDPGAQGAFGESLLTAIADEADASDLAFDPGVEANEIGDALDSPLALTIERLNAAYVTAQAAGAGPLRRDQRLRIAEQLGAAESSSTPLAVDLHGAFAASPESRGLLEGPWLAHERTARELHAALDSAAQSDDPARSSATLKAKHRRFIQAASVLSGALEHSLRAMLHARRIALERDRLALIVQLTLGILLSVGVAYMIGRDVIRRQRRALFRAQRDSAAAQFRTIFERSPIGIALLDATGAILESNAGLNTMLDAPSTRVIEAGDPEFQAMVEGRVPLYRFERRWMRDDGKAIWTEVTVSPVGGKRYGQVAAIAMIQDVTERRAADATLRYAATHDALTALPNRSEFIRSLNGVLESEAGSGGQYAVLFIDLDGFKAVNDRLGHLAGDRVIEVAAQRMRQACRTSDFVARFHGDEFALLLVNVDGMRIANSVADRVQEELRAPIFVNGQAAFVSPSIGIVLGNPRYTMAEEVLRDADAAMYRAKALGGSRAVAFEYREAS